MNEKTKTTEKVHFSKEGRDRYETIFNIEDSHEGSSRHPGGFHTPYSIYTRHSTARFPRVLAPRVAPLACTDNSADHDDTPHRRSSRCACSGSRSLRLRWRSHSPYCPCRPILRHDMEGFRLDRELCNRRLLPQRGAGRCPAVDARGWGGWGGPTLAVGTTSTTLWSITIATQTSSGSLIVPD